MAEGTSVIDLILRDHRRAKRLLMELESVSDDDLLGYLSKLREKLVRHGFAEELIVYPALRTHVHRGDAIAKSCLAEQHRANTALAGLDCTELPCAELRGQLEELRDAVFTHLEHEHVDVLPSLLRSFDETELGALGDRYDKALAAGATYYRPRAPKTAVVETVLVAPVPAVAEPVAAAAAGAVQAA
jgi:hypothetical protein